MESDTPGDGAVACKMKGKKKTSRAMITSDGASESGDEWHLPDLNFSEDPTREEMPQISQIENSLLPIASQARKRKAKANTDREYQAPSQKRSQTPLIIFLLVDLKSNL